MNYLDEIQRKRQEDSEEYAELSDQRSKIIRAKRSSDAITNAIKEANDDSKKHREDTTIKVEVQNAEIEVNNLPDMALRQDIANLLTAIDSLADRLKPESVEFTPVVGALKELGSKLDELPKSFPEQEPHPESVKIDNLAEIQSFFKPLEEAMRKIDVKPVVNVERVEQKDIDFTPVIEALNKPEEVEFEFEDYIAQDIDNESETHQYVGLQNPKGEWCIIENDFTSLRFVFGSKNYAKSWKNKASLNYRLFAEAVNAT